MVFVAARVYIPLMVLVVFNVIELCVVYILMDIFINHSLHMILYSVACVIMVIGFGCCFVYTLRMVYCYGFDLGLVMYPSNPKVDMHEKT